MVKNAAAIIVVLISAPTAARAQIEEHGFQEEAPARSDPLGTNLASISFNKSLNTYHWNGFTFYKNVLGPL